MRGIKPMRSLDYRSGSVRLYEFENQSLTDLKPTNRKVHRDNYPAKSYYGKKITFKAIGLSLIAIGNEHP